MQPVVGVGRQVVGATRLGQLVLMVREGQVDAAAMDVDRQAQHRLDHRRAFDVPAGTAGAPGARPLGLAGLGRLPQHEVGRVALVGGDLDPGAGDHLVQRPARQLAIVGEGLDREQHMALGRIGGAAGDQGGDLVLHGLDMVGGVRRQRRRQGLQRRGVGVVGGQVAVGDGLDRHALGRGLGVDLVVHVGDVPGIDHRVLTVEVAQNPEQDVEHHHRPEVADVGVAVDRRPTDIHRHPLGIGGNEGPLFAGHGVVELQGHFRLTLRERLPGRRAVPYSFQQRAKPRLPAT